MKKTFLLFFLVGSSVIGCFAQKNKKVELKTEIDTVSYSYGVSLVQQGMIQYLYMQNALGDTAQVAKTYRDKIKQESDLAKKDALTKELTFKLDSINKQNKANLPQLLKGLMEGLNDDPKKSAYMKGLALGSQINDMLPQFLNQVYGEDSKTTISRPHLLVGLTDALENNDLKVETPVEVIQQKISANQEKQTLKRETELEAKYADDIKAGRDFLAENAEQEGVVVTPMGWQYKVINEGTGPKPKATDRVKVHYTGTLIDGTVFDSSRRRGEPLVLGVNEVITGWTEALKIMPVGSRWMLYIPYELGYGTRSAGSIKPYSTLVFDVELLGIEK